MYFLSGGHCDVYIIMSGISQFVSVLDNIQKYLYCPIAFCRHSCAPVALFSAPVTKYVSENYLPIKVSFSWLCTIHFFLTLKSCMPIYIVCILFECQNVYICYVNVKCWVLNCTFLSCIYNWSLSHTQLFSSDFHSMIFKVIGQVLLFFLYREP